MKQQQGMVLVIGLILLSGLAILGISATSSSMLELKVSRNAEVTTDTFQNADAIINSLLNWERSALDYPFQGLNSQNPTRKVTIDNHDVTITYIPMEPKNLQEENLRTAEPTCENNTLVRILGTQKHSVYCTYFEIDISLQQGSKQLQAGSHLVQGAAEGGVSAKYPNAIHLSGSDF